MLVSVQLQSSKLTQLTVRAGVFTHFKWIALQLGCAASFWHIPTTAEKLQVLVPG